MTWEKVAPEGIIYSSTTPHPSTRLERPRSISSLVELPHAGNVRMIGNLLGDPHQDVIIGSRVGVFEPHDDTDPPYTLVQWKVV